MKPLRDVGDLGLSVERVGYRSLGAQPALPKRVTACVFEDVTGRGHRHTGNVEKRQRAPARLDEGVVIHKREVPGKKRVQAPDQRAEALPVELRCHMLP